MIEGNIYIICTLIYPLLLLMLLQRRCLLRLRAREVSHPCHVGLGRIPTLPAPNGPTTAQGHGVVVQRRVHEPPLPWRQDLTHLLVSLCRVAVLSTSPAGAPERRGSRIGRDAAGWDTHRTVVIRPRDGVEIGHGVRPRGDRPGGERACRHGGSHGGRSGGPCGEVSGGYRVGADAVWVVVAVVGVLLLQLIGQVDAENTSENVT